VIHLRVSGVASVDEQQKVVRRLTKHYPHSNPLQEFSLRIDTTGGEVAVDQKPQGFRLNTDDQADVVLVFPDGIAAARLAPYQGWENLRDCAKAAHDEWRRSTAHRPVSRIGIRYLNRIDIPLNGLSQVDLATYLGFRPHIPGIGSGPMAGYMVQATLPTDIPQWSASIASTIVTPPPLLNHVSLMLDIDIFRTEQIPGNESELWRMIDDARPIKNRVFERCITDESRKLFA
jgi:uncharacterized protein (TIGR04255 family)